MAKLFVYDAFNNRFYTYDLNENDPMPYSYGSTLKLREFRGSSGANVLWTTTAAMEAWNLTRRTYGKSIPVGYAFKRIWEGGHGTTSQHYAGVAFDVGQSSGADARKAIYNAAVATKAWGYVEPLSQTYGRLPHGTPRQPQHLCAGAAGRPERPGLHHRHAGWRVRCQDRDRPERCAAPLWPDGRRSLRMQQLEKDHRGRRRHRPHLDRD